MLACTGEGRPQWSAFVDAGPCPKEVEATLIEWSASGEALATPPGPAGSERLRVPTAQLGVWLQLDRSATTTVVTRVTLETEETRSFGARCVPAQDVRSRPLPWAEGSRDRYFTDDDLRAAVAGGVPRGAGSDPAAATDPAASRPRATVVYVWSPHMPLSVDGYAEIAGACERLGLALVPVLFPDADRAFAGREAERVDMPVEALREAVAVELVFRDALVHAPAVLAFVGDRAAPVMPGYRDQAGYVRYLAELIGNEAPGSAPD